MNVKVLGEARWEQKTVDAITLTTWKGESELGHVESTLEPEW